MNGSTKPDDRFTRGMVFVLYVTLFVISITSVSMIQINLNTSTAYTLNIEYEQHTVTGNGLSLNHGYNTIIVNIPIMVDNYESTLSSYQVGTFPFWVDTSDWAEGENVSISGNLYSVVSETGSYVALSLRMSTKNYGTTKTWGYLSKVILIGCHLGRVDGVEPM